MNKYTWILWAVILMIPGAAGLGYHFSQKGALQEEIALAAEAVAESAATDEYLGMYEKWVALDPEQKAENPWGQDPYGGPEIQNRLAENRADRLTADLPDLDKGLKHYPEELARELYGHGWRRAVEDYRNRQSKADMILIGSVFLLAGGGLLLLGGITKMLLVFSLGRLKWARNDATEESDEQTAQRPESDTDGVSPLDDFRQGTLSRSLPVSDAEKVIASSRAANSQENPPRDKNDLGYFGTRRKSAQKVPSAPTDGKGSLSELSKSRSVATTLETKEPQDSYFGWALKETEAAMETLMTTEPLTKELNELTEEMSAIRQFAVQQQDQVRKLQDGYDWMIIRRFCLRIIRSVDNIEDRINRMNEPDSELVMCLEDIRDELVFALESSGVEQFKPDVEVSFKGLEKYAEAVRQRVPTDDDALSGCIAEIVRPGYQYLISEDDVKIVRCAQIRLYETQPK